MPTPEQQAERAAAWKAKFAAEDAVMAARMDSRNANAYWWAVIKGAGDQTYQADGSFTLDGVVYLPDGTTRAAE